MSNLKVHGYKHITFWQEDGIGVIALRTDSRGIANVDIISELIMAFGTAVADDDVKSVALTGINRNFLAGLNWYEESQDFLETVDMSHTLVNIIAALKKPVFCLLNGDAYDYGYELALLSDCIIAVEGANVGFNSGYLFMGGGTATWPRFRTLGRAAAAAGTNVDLVVPSGDNFLEEAKKFILANSGFDFSSVRKISLANIASAILIETDNLLRSLYRREKQAENSGDTPS